MNSQQFEKIGDLLARQHKIAIIEGSGWAANVKKRQVFYKKRDIYVLSEEHLLGLLLHEIAHIHYTTEMDYPQKNKELMMATINMLEDIAVENIISKDYPNAGEILASTEQEVLDTMVRILPKMDESVQEKSLYYASVKFQGRGYSMSTMDYEMIGSEISELMAKRSREIYGRAKTADLLPLAQSIVEIILKYAGEPTPEQKARMARESAGQTNADRNQSQQKFKSQVIRRLGGLGHDPSSGELEEPIVKFVDSIADQSIMIGKQLRSILKRNNAMEFGGRYRSGRILAKRLARVRILKDHRGFARRIVKSNQSYAFAVAADVSGSMFGYGGDVREGDCALSSMHMVGEALRIARVPRAMVVFGARAKVVTPMSSKAIRWNQISANNSIRRAGQNSTDISRAMMACISELRGVKAERKIMIILTDGSSGEYDMRQAHNEAMRYGIECMGITLGRSSGERMDRIFTAKQNVMIPSGSASGLIGQAFIKVLKNTITASTT